jgi:hypothetical protein
VSAFESQLRLGRMGELLVSGFLKGRGCGVLPSYDYTGSDGNKAPRLMFQVERLVVPDLDTAKDGARKWVEVKTHWHAPENRFHGICVHGIKRRHRDDYLAVEKHTGCPVFLAVVEVATAELLVARLAALKTYHCLCPGCRPRKDSRPGHLVYFNRADFTVWHRFADSAIAPLRDEFTRAKGEAA